MMQLPKFLSKGDPIHILAPAKRVDAASVHLAADVLETAGYRVSISKHCLGEHHYFSGSIEERLSDLQEAINNQEIRAIICARGGYGCVQLVDRLDWTAFQKQPKWIIGFSDVTVLHSRIQSMGISSIHGTMPLNFKDHTQAARETLIQAISGQLHTITATASKNNQTGSASGLVMGGNLTIIASLIGTNDQPHFQDSLLFVEEVGEPLYSVDRMFYSLKKAGILKNIKGLIVGGMTSMKDSEIPYGKTLEEIITRHTADLNIPVAFNIPAGHIDDNQAILLGTKATLEVTEVSTALTFHT